MNKRSPTVYSLFLKYLQTSETYQNAVIDKPNKEKHQSSIELWNTISTNKKKEWKDLYATVQSYDMKKIYETLFVNDDELNVHIEKLRLNINNSDSNDKSNNFNIQLPDITSFRKTQKLVKQDQIESLLHYQLDLDIDNPVIISKEYLRSLIQKHNKN